MTSVLDPGHAIDVIDLVRMDGADHDTLSLHDSAFDGSTAELPRSACKAEGLAVFLDLATDDDTEKLVSANGVSSQWSQLRGNRGSFSFQLGRLTGQGRASAGPCCSGSRVGRRTGKSVERRRLTRRGCWAERRES